MLSKLSERLNQGTSLSKVQIVSDVPVNIETFQEYGNRFDIEENFLDDKSNGFQLEDSRIRSAEALERLCMPFSGGIGEAMYGISSGNALSGVTGSRGCQKGQA
jgi:hypothetical protein